MMRCACSRRLALLLARPAARRHAGRQRQRHHGRPRRQGHPLHAMMIDAQGRIVKTATAAATSRRALDYRENGRGRTRRPRHDRRARSCHGPRPRRAGARPVGHAVRSTKRRRSSPPMPRPIPTGRGSSARGWNQELWGLGRFPTAAELDAVVADRPVWLERVDGHAGWANSVAHATAGVTATTADPAGGRIERIAGGRQPAGVFVDAAHGTDRSQGPAAAPRATATSRFLKAQEMLLRHGVTAVADMGTSIEDWHDLSPRGRHRPAARAHHVLCRERARDAADRRRRARRRGSTTTGCGWAGSSSTLDGALGSRGAWLKAPYADAPGQQRAAADDGTAAAQHDEPRGDGRLPGRGPRDRRSPPTPRCSSAIDELSADYTGDRRWRIEHAQIVDPADLPRFGQHGIDRLDAAGAPDVRPADGRGAARAGPARPAPMPGARCTQTGAPLAFGSDSPVEVPDPFAGMGGGDHAARTPTASRSAAGIRREAVTREQALAAYTAGAAYAGFAEGKFGRSVPASAPTSSSSIADPLMASAADLREIRVLETWIGGEKVYDVDGDAPPAPRTRRAVGRFPQASAKPRKRHLLTTRRYAPRLRC